MAIRYDVLKNNIVTYTLPLLDGNPKASAIAVAGIPSANVLVNICQALHRLKSECVIIGDSAAVAVAVQPGVFLVADQ